MKREEIGALTQPFNYKLETGKCYGGKTKGESELIFNYNYSISPPWGLKEKFH